TVEDVTITVLTSSIKSSSHASTVNGTLSGVKQNETTTTSSRLRPRADCESIQVEPENGCAILAERCEISLDDLTDFNPSDNFCGSIIPDQWICCSEGTLPYLGPKENADGTCVSHQVGSGETCDSIATANNIKTDQIEEFNENSWGWNTCDKLIPDQLMCLSTGDPPMPFQDPVNLVDCGPSKIGTERPDDWDNISGLNQCPLRACCSRHGFCGLTDEFCEEEESLSGAPGTAGCISNCGMEITNNDEGPESFIKVAYFEAWNQERPCLNMDVTQIDKEVFTHVHFAFPDITADYHVDMSKIQDQFDKFE
ncbi:LysM peptidoglycan-binding domain-containing protein, partial [Candidatus Bathyarchaeota archaeon]|nr:LysM peptidoglycan-binding domain-containing protein [Candidatus Bathyarchaeota archaeon]